MKNLMLFPLMFIFSHSFFAQVNQRENVQFGMKAGIVFSHMDFSQGYQASESSASTNWQPGLTAGFIVIVPISGNLYFQPEYLFLQMGGEIENEDISYKLNYLSLPAFLRWNFLERWSLIVGPQFDLLINASENSDGNKTSLEHSIEHRSIGITGGVDFKLFESLQVGASYMNGFNNIGLEGETGVQEFKFRKFQVSVTYLF